MKNLYLLTFLILLTTCASTKLITKKEYKNLHQKISESPTFTKGFTGFQLYDPVSKKVLYDHLANKYFTPASNTKIFTYYTAKKILGDSIPSLNYIIKGDSLIFWGTGDPSLLHPHLRGNQKVIQFLNSQKEALFYCPDNFMDSRYGAGWMWDDYPYYYQVEKAALPVYGNFIHVTGTKESYSFRITPNYFTQKVADNSTLGGSTARFYRKEKSNIIEYNQKAVGASDIDRELPFIYTDSLAIQLLQDSVNRPIKLISNLGISPPKSQTIYGISTDTILQRMMRKSDNFLAEQLILLCANALFDTLNTKKGINWAKDSLFKKSPDELLWYDGSGLTRYNQFTPRSIVYVLEKIYTETPMQDWQSVFSDENESTFYFDGRNQPFIYAKTGSMRNVRCLSGFLLTQSGRTLIFSIMNNHIPSNSQSWTAEMEQVLRWLHEEL